MKLFFLLLGATTAVSSAYVPPDASGAIAPAFLYTRTTTRDYGCGGSFMNSLRVSNTNTKRSPATCGVESVRGGLYDFDEEDLKKINVFPVCGGTFMNSLGSLSDENVPLHQEEWVSPETLLPDTVVRQRSTPLLDRYQKNYQTQLSRQQALAEKKTVASSFTSTPDQAKRWQEEGVKSISVEQQPSKKVAQKASSSTKTVASSTSTPDQAKQWQEEGVKSISVPRQPSKVAQKATSGGIKTMNIGAKAVANTAPATKPLNPDQPTKDWLKEEVKEFSFSNDRMKASKVDQTAAAAAAAAVATKPMTPDQAHGWTEEQDH